MKFSIRVGGLVACVLAISAGCASITPMDTAIPHLEKRGLATQLIVDGKIYELISAGKFPKPIKFDRVARWRRSDLDRWAEDLLYRSRPRMRH